MFFCKKSLHGLKQFPSQWYKRFDKCMIENGFSRSKYDSCVYMREVSGGSLLYLLLYVDDMLVIAKDMLEVKEVKDMLKRELEMKYIGATMKILGMKIIRDRTKQRLYLSGEKYIERVLERFHMSDVKPVSTPLALQTKLFKMDCPRSKEDNDYMSSVLYANGGEKCAMIGTRLGIAQAVSGISTYMANSGKAY